MPAGIATGAMGACVDRLSRKDQAKDLVGHRKTRADKSGNTDSGMRRLEGRKGMWSKVKKVNGHVMSPQNMISLDLYVYSVQSYTRFGTLLRKQNYPIQTNSHLPRSSAHCASSSSAAPSNLARSEPASLFHAGAGSSPRGESGGVARGRGVFQGDSTPMPLPPTDVG
jgi:hypothetical protein